jgi:hypothetical protein
MGASMPIGIGLGRDGSADNHNSNGGAEMEPIGKTAMELVQSEQRLTSTARTSAEKLSVAQEYTRILLGCYDKTSISDPAVFTAAVIAVLARFPESVMRAVCDPVRGLPVQMKWFPKISEIQTACNDELRHQETIARYAAMGTINKSKPAGDPANVFVPSNTPPYERIAALCSEENRGSWHLDDGGRSGVWVPLQWVLSVSPQSRVYGMASRERELSYGVK